LSGTTTPASTVGVVGDFYLDTSSPETLYGPKTSTGWPSTGTSLVGPQGPAGVTGIVISPTSTVTISAGGVKPVAASCPSGDYAISGQWNTTAGVEVITSAEGLSPDTYNWVFDFYNSFSVSQAVTYSVVCAQVG
jgi:hypothetical protein